MADSSHLSQYSQSSTDAFMRLLLDDDDTTQLSQGQPTQTLLSQTPTCTAAMECIDTDTPQAHQTAQSGQQLCSSKNDNINSVEASTPSQSILDEPAEGETPVSRQRRPPRASKASKTWPTLATKAKAKTCKPKQQKLTQTQKATPKKRKLADPTSPSEHTDIPVEAAPSQDSVVTLANAIHRLSDQMRDSIGDLSARIGNLESSLEAKIKKHVQSAINPEISKIKKDFNAEIRDIKSNIDDIARACAINSEARESCPHTDSGDNARALNLIIRNLPQSETESDNSVKEDVDKLIKDGLKLRVRVVNVVRKQPRHHGDNGVVILTCRNQEDKAAIMKAKATLRNNRAYSRVYIEYDMTYDERNNVTNLKTIAKVIGNDKVFVRGNKLVPRDHRRNDSNSRNSSSQQDDWHEVRYNRSRGQHPRHTTSRSDRRQEPRGTERDNGRYHQHVRPVNVRQTYGYRD